MKAAEIKYNGSVIASPEAGQVVTLKCAGKKMIDDLIMEVTKNSGIGDLIELEIMPETVVSYNNDVGAYILPYHVQWNNVNPYMVVINGKTYMPTTMGVSQGGGTIVGNTGLFEYYGNEYGSFGIMCTHYNGLCALILDSEYFPNLAPITVRIYKLLSKIDATDFMDGYLMAEPYQEYAFEDDTIEGIPEGAFDNEYVFSAKSQSAEYIGYNAFNTSSLSVIDCPNVRYIDEYALSYAKGLVNANLPSVEEIYNSGFYYCSGLNILDFHKLQYIDSYAFSNCASLSVLVIRSESVCTLSSPDAFSRTPFDSSYNTYKQGGILLVPRALIDAYWNETNWAAVMNSGFNTILPLEACTVDGTITGELGPNPNNVVVPGLYKEISEINTTAMVSSWEELLDNEFICVDNGVVYANTNGYSDLGILNGTLILPDDGSITAVGDAVVGDDGNLIGRTGFENCYNLTGIVLPSSVTSIGISAFASCSKLTAINIPDGVTSIGIAAFSDCINLTIINIPDSVTSIGWYAFYNCPGLTSISIPDGVASIGDGAFQGCFNLTSITIPDSVTSIGEYAFQDCSNLTNIAIPNGVTTIGQSAFYNCSNLTSIDIPDGVDNIGDYMFYNCFNLTNISLPSSADSIGEYAFYECSNLTSIDIPDGIDSIGQYAFYNCSNLTSIGIVPDGVTSIGEYAFYNCYKLTSINFPDGITSIGQYAFQYCYALGEINIPGSVTTIEANTFQGSGITAVTIGEGVTSIGTYAFQGCTNLKSAVIPDSVTIISNYAFQRAAMTTIELGNGVQTIGSYAFDQCTVLKTANIPDSVTSIGSYAFQHCYVLGEIRIPDGVTIISSYAFQNCRSARNLTIGENVTKIDYSAFAGCDAITEVIIPSSVTEVGSYAFYSCDSLASVTILAETPPKSGQSMFTSTSTLANIYVPADSVEAYKSTSYWANFKSKITAITA